MSRLPGKVGPGQVGEAIRGWGQGGVAGGRGPLGRSRWEGETGQFCPP